MALDLSRLAMLEARLAGLLPAGLAVACTDPGDEVPRDEVFDTELAAMARAVPRRRREFLAGRKAARRAMAGLGLRPAPVMMAPDRVPVWPEGLIGSISHCDDACAAIVGRAKACRSVAVDLEPDLALPAELEPVVCLPQEQAWLASLPKDARGRAARLIFSVKECAYKLQYPVTKEILDFTDLRVEVDVDTARFVAQFRRDLPEFGDGQPLTGQFGVEGGTLFCVMCLM
ncbi:4'-phosphopantetheinyl transferase family protein [Marimonas arenosa]|uniref:Enterobactin synthase component D n=1 Tax=Marimonas arenosa TaxID=1795305 RepID=A0AAE3WAX6_9RHOB|nr:4'-phosphopantetheinyl transferase superfamily protein [Marimonas arenosa]MDQ2089349.1 4'-phosphopantetheinyl transferase superfamily protein [Marimonas arenosa]